MSKDAQSIDQEDIGKEEEKD